MTGFFQYVAANYAMLLQYTMQHIRIGMLAVLGAIIVGVPLGLLISKITPASKPVLADKKGENYVDTAVKILIAVVLGALLLAGLYALFGDVVMPTLTERIREMFNYAG